MSLVQPSAFSVLPQQSVPVTVKKVPLIKVPNPFTSLDHLAIDLKTKNIKAKPIEAKPSTRKPFKPIKDDKYRNYEPKPIEPKRNKPKEEYEKWRDKTIKARSKENTTNAQEKPLPAQEPIPTVQEAPPPVPIVPEKSPTVVQEKPLPAQEPIPTVQEAPPPVPISTSTVPQNPTIIPETPTPTEKLTPTVQETPPPPPAPKSKPIDSNIRKVANNTFQATYRGPKTNSFSWGKLGIGAGIGVVVIGLVAAGGYLTYSYFQSKKKSNSNTDKPTINIPELKIELNLNDDATINISEPIVEHTNIVNANDNANIELLNENLNILHEQKNKAKLFLSDIITTISVCKLADTQNIIADLLKLKDWVYRVREEHDRIKGNFRATTDTIRDIISRLSNNINHLTNIDQHQILQNKISVINDNIQENLKNVDVIIGLWEHVNNKEALKRDFATKVVEATLWLNRTVEEIENQEIALFPDNLNYLTQVFEKLDKTNKSVKTTYKQFENEQCVSLNELMNQYSISSKKLQTIFANPLIIRIRDLVSTIARIEPLLEQINPGRDSFQQAWVTRRNSNALGNIAQKTVSGLAELEKLFKYLKRSFVYIKKKIDVQPYRTYFDDLEDFYLKIHTAYKNKSKYLSIPSQINQ